jgi:hypothetical protein
MEEDIKRLTKDYKFDSALTLYPVQEPTILFQLHAYFCKVSGLNNAAAKMVYSKHTNDSSKLCRLQDVYHDDNYNLGIMKNL